MFRIFGASAQDCDGLTRRGFLLAGVLGLGGLTLPDLLRFRAEAAGGPGTTGEERHLAPAERGSGSHWRSGTRNLWQRADSVAHLAPFPRVSLGSVSGAQYYPFHHPSLSLPESSNSLWWWTRPDRENVARSRLVEQSNKNPM